MFKRVCFGIFITLLFVCALSPGAKTQPRNSPARAGALRDPNVTRAPAADTASAKRKVSEVLKLITGSREDLNIQDIRTARIETGQSAVGVVLLEDEEQLSLDTSYCENDPYKKQIVTFFKPYKKSNPEEVGCPSSGAYGKIKVKQGRSRFLPFK